MDIDHVRDPITGTIEGWAQRFLDRASHSYAEISPSGTGLRIWGTASGKMLHRKFSFDGSALELFRRTRKPLTVTGLQLGNNQALGNIDTLLDRGVVWAQQRQQKLSKTKPEITAGTTAQYSIDQIEMIVSEGAPDGANRSDTFHGIVGHYLGCGWTVQQITEHLAEFPDGIGSRYIAENRLGREVERSAGAFGANANPSASETWSNGFHKEDQEEQRQSAEDPPDVEDIEEQAKPELPPMYAHGDPDPRPIKAWTIKGLLLTQGHGLLSGQWGTFKSFLALELAGCLMTGQPFLDRLIKRQSGVLFLAAEGQHEMRSRLQALMQEKCGGMTRAPFRWFEDVPVLLQPNGLELLVAMGRQAAASCSKNLGCRWG
jgi:AAA domain